MQTSLWGCLLNKTSEYLLLLLASSRSWNPLLPLKALHKSSAHWNLWASPVVSALEGRGKPLMQTELELADLLMSHACFQKKQELYKVSDPIWTCCAVSGFSWCTGLSVCVGGGGRSFGVVFLVFKAFHFSFDWIWHCSVPPEKAYCSFQALWQNLCVAFANQDWIWCSQNADLLHWRCSPAAVRKTLQGLFGSTVVLQPSKSKQSQMLCFPNPGFLSVQQSSIGWKLKQRV